MLISQCEILNYKSFHSSGPIELGAGFNVVVGTNNAGKTAFLEAVSLGFTNLPHRSPSTVKRPGFPHDQQSRVRMWFMVSAEELHDIVGRLQTFYVPRRGGEGFTDLQARFDTEMQHHDELESVWTPRLESVTSARFGPYAQQRQAALGTFDPVSESFRIQESFVEGADQQGLLPARIAEALKERLYFFKAERLSLGESAIISGGPLAADASNLPGVLHMLQSSNPARFDHFNEYVTSVFPDIRRISVVPVAQGRARILVWSIPHNTEREDLAVALSESGTGVGQVLAMIYVVITAPYPQTLIIDEPQSFLHPGAIRKLFEILRRYPLHQYIVSTHSPTVVTAANPNIVLLLKRENMVTKVQALDVSQTDDLRLLLAEIGARLSDVFGADDIFWVEGKTEEICFRLVMTELLKIDLLGTEIVGVASVGDLERRRPNAEAVLRVYERLCSGRGLLPPAIAFSFDREGRDQQQRSRLVEKSGGRIHFIPRRMYENFLMHPVAIASIINAADNSRPQRLTKQDITSWLQSKGTDSKYGKDLQDWGREVDAARLLNDLFNDVTEARVAYNKVKHGVQLTEWLIKNAPHELNELADYLQAIFNEQKDRQP